MTLILLQKPKDNFFFFLPFSNSDSEETANNEIQFFFPEIDIDKFREEIRKFLEEKGTMFFNEKSCEHECRN